MVLLHLRVFYKTDELEKLILFIKKEANLHLVCKENEEEDDKRQHIHALINFEKTLSTFRQHFRGKFPEYKGNESYSLETVRDQQRMEQYICKGFRDGMPEIVGKSHGYTDNQIEKHHTAYWVEYDGLRKAVEVRKKHKGNWTQEVRDELLKKKKDWEFSPEDTLAVYDMVMKKLGETAKKLNERIVRDMVLGLLNSLSAHTASGLRNFMLQKAFPDLHEFQ